MAFYVVEQEIVGIVFVFHDSNNFQAEISVTSGANGGVKVGVGAPGFDSGK